MIFSWNGKNEARRIAKIPSTGTLIPCKEKSKNWDTTENLYIEGDNLEVLKLLQKSYHNKVKMIYIDPPYNTGKDFVYKDNFKDNIKNYMEKTGQFDCEGNKLSTNSESNGRYHSDWLSMMYPRLKLARNLLKDDGVIFISIDDNEVQNLRKICDEIFGGENFITQFIWEKRTTRENRRVFSVNHDYILCYAKQKNKFEEIRNLLPLTNEAKERYKNPDNDKRGVWQSVSLNAQAGHATQSQFYTIEVPSGKQVNPPSGRCWSVIKDKYQLLVEDNRIWFGEKGNNVPRRKVFLNEIEQGLTPHTLWRSDEVGSTDSAKKELIKLFNGQETMDTPKSVILMQRLIHISSNENDIILDFFSGSATTAHALMQLNAEDGEKRKHIMVQLPELTNEKSEAKKAGYKNICEIGKARIDKAGNKILKDNKDKEGIENLDIGFKVFKLDSSNIKIWDGESKDLVNRLYNIVDNIKEDRKEEDVLYEILLKYGLELTYPIDELEVNNNKIYSIGFGALIICLSINIDLETVEAIGKYKKEKAVERMSIVFKDTGFKNDTIKTNSMQILKQCGIDDVKSI